MTPVFSAPNGSARNQVAWKSPLIPTHLFAIAIVGVDVKLWLALLALTVPCAVCREGAAAAC